MANTARFELKNMAREHDWYGAMSDDHRVMEHAHIGFMKIKHLAEELSCPFNIQQIMKWATNMSVVHMWQPDVSDAWYPRTLRGEEYKYCAPTPRAELLSGDEWHAIEAWFSAS